MSFLENFNGKSVVNLHREGRMCFIFFKSKATFFIPEFHHGICDFKKTHSALHEDKNLIHIKWITKLNGRGKTIQLL